MSYISAGKLEKKGLLFVYHLPFFGLQIEISRATLHPDGGLTATLRVSADGQHLPVGGLINLASIRSRDALAKDLEGFYPLPIWRRELARLYILLEDALLDLCLPEDSSFYPMLKERILGLLAQSTPCTEKEFARALGVPESLVRSCLEELRREKKVCPLGWFFILDSPGEASADSDSA